MADADSGDPNEISILTKPFHRRGSVLLRGPLHSCNCIVGYATSVWRCQSLVEEGWLPERANNIWAEKRLYHHCYRWQCPRVVDCKPRRTCMLKGVRVSGFGSISSNSRIHLRQYHVCLYVSVLFAARPAPFMKLQIDIPPEGLNNQHCER